MTPTPRLCPSGATLRAEFNTLAPARDHASDGWIGDAAHQQEDSDHNPDARGVVHAIDVDDDLNESDLTMERVVQFLIGRCRTGAERRLTYVIYNRRIWSASHSWTQRTYTGKSPHTEHAHFSFTVTAEGNTSPWHLGDIPVALTDADKKWFIAELDAAAARAADRLRKSQTPGWSDTSAHNLAVDTARMVAGDAPADYWGDRAKNA